MTKARSAVASRLALTLAARVAGSRPIPDPCRGLQSRHSDARAFGCRTPREAASVRNALLFIIQTDAALAFAMMAEVDAEMVLLVIIVAAEMD